MDINGSGNLAYFFNHRRGHGKIVGDVATDHLNVDGRRKTEVQNLTHDVGRLEVEGRAGELFWQRVAQLRNIFIGWLVPGCERHQNLGIGVPYNATVAVREVDAANGQANIIEDATHFR